ncbi:hypothetical protein D3C72_1866970 [compost metagenome]
MAWSPLSAMRSMHRRRCSSSSANSFMRRGLMRKATSTARAGIWGRPAFALSTFQGTPRATPFFLLNRREWRSRATST